MLRLLRKFNLTPIRTSLHYLLVLNVGMDGLLGVSGTIITSDYDHSRLAPERLYITIKSPPLSSVHHHSYPTETIHPCNPSPCVSGTCSGRLWDFMVSKCARVCWSMPRGSSTGNFRPLSACTWRLGAGAWWPRADRGWVHHGFTMFHQQKGDFNGSDHQYLGDKMGCNNMFILGHVSYEPFINGISPSKYPPIRFADLLSLQRP